MTVKLTAVYVSEGHEEEDEEENDEHTGKCGAAVASTLCAACLLYERVSQGLLGTFCSLFGLLSFSWSFFTCHSLLCSCLCTLWPVEERAKESEKSFLFLSLSLSLSLSSCDLCTGVSIASGNVEICLAKCNEHRTVRYIKSLVE